MTENEALSFAQVREGRVLYRLTIFSVTNRPFFPSGQQPIIHRDFRAGFDERGEGLHGYPSTGSFVLNSAVQILQFVELFFVQIYNNAVSKSGGGNLQDGAGAGRYGTADGPGKGGLVLDVKEEPNKDAKKKSNCCNN